VDVDSLFALEPPIPDENASTAPASSVFFDSAPTTGRASRFRQLFAQEPVPAPMNSFSPEPRPNTERMNSNPLFNNGPKPGASEEDREGFQRIMSMLGGAGNKPNMSNVVILSINLLIVVYGQVSAFTITAATTRNARWSSIWRIEKRVLPTSAQTRSTNGTQSATIRKPSNADEPSQ
jgi:hypothetical protein